MPISNARRVKEAESETDIVLDIGREARGDVLDGARPLQRQRRLSAVLARLDGLVRDEFGDRDDLIRVSIKLSRRHPSAATHQQGILSGRESKRDD